MDTVYQPNYKAEARTNLCSGVTGIEALKEVVDAVSAMAQAAEDDIFNLATTIPLEKAGAYMLGRWGLLLDERRGNLAIEEYRRLLKAKLIAIWSDGTASALYILATTIIPGAVITITETAPCNYTLLVATAVTIHPELVTRLAKLVRMAKPAGINGIYIQATDTSFAFAGGLDGLGFNTGGLAGLF